MLNSAFLTAKVVIHWMIIIAMELRISEHDEAGRNIATYISFKGSDRIELIVCLVHPITIIGRVHQG